MRAVVLIGLVPALIQAWTASLPTNTALFNRLQALSAVNLEALPKLTDSGLPHDVGPFHQQTAESLLLSGALGDEADLGTELGKWVLLIYVVFSLLAGLKEFATRANGWIENRTTTKTKR